MNWFRMSSNRSGQLVILSSPSGGGKTSICRELLTAERRDAGWTFSISYTTRQRREGEKNGREYHFVPATEFDSLIAQDFFAEHFQVHLYKYGTPRGPLEAVVREGGVMLLDVDIQGARQLKTEYPDAIAIFILPPSLDALQDRLAKRGTETAEQLALRFARAREEMSAFRDYPFDYVVINDTLPEAVADVLAIVRAHPRRRDRWTTEQLDAVTR